MRQYSTGVKRKTLECDYLDSTPGQPCISCVTWDKLLNFSVTQSPHVRKGDNKYTCPMGFLGGRNELIYGKCLKRSKAFCKVNLHC